MSSAASRRPLPLARPLIDDSTLATGLAAGLLVAACVHLVLAVEHGVTVFALCVAAAGVAQAMVAITALRGHARSVSGVVMVMSLVLMQLYALNVTTGLPPVIAHTHTPGTHVVLGIVLASPNALDAQGVLTQVAQAVAVACAAALGRARASLAT